MQKQTYPGTTSLASSTGISNNDEVSRPRELRVPEEDRRIRCMGDRGGAVEAYDRIAQVYDEFTRANDYEIWLGEVLLPELEKHGGLRVGRVLDVGCGTGRAFDPLWQRGWEYWGCDSSSKMLRIAKAKPRARAEGRYPVGYLFEADACDLPDLPAGPADLVLALNDVINYLTEDGELERAFSGMRRNLAPHGLLSFDCLTLGTMRAAHVAGYSWQEGELTWTGLTESIEPGGIGEWEMASVGFEASRHRVRHHPVAEVLAALEASGLRCLSVQGQREEPGQRVILGDPDETETERTIYIAGAEK
jgi:SAM-dependent methyltransferase